MRFEAVGAAPALVGLAAVVAWVVVVMAGGDGFVVVSVASVIATSSEAGLLSSSVTVSFANPGAVTMTVVFAPRAGRGTRRTLSASVSLPTWSTAFVGSPRSSIDGEGADVVLLVTLGGEAAPFGVETAPRVATRAGASSATAWLLT